MIARTSKITALKQLAETWRKRAAHKFRDAKLEKVAIGKRLIEHGAMCYFNCSEELRKFADGLQAAEIVVPLGRNLKPNVDGK